MGAAQTGELREEGGGREGGGGDESPKGPGDARGDHGDGSQPAIADLALRRRVPKFPYAQQARRFDLSTEIHRVGPSSFTQLQQLHVAGFVPIDPNRSLERTHQNGALTPWAVRAPPVTRYRGTMPGRVVGREVRRTDGSL